MPIIQLTAGNWRSPLIVCDPVGNRVPILRPQFRCFVRLPGTVLPQDGIIDTGAPLTCVPKLHWDGLREGTDFEWLSAPPGTPPFTGAMANWSYTFRLARFLAPVVLMDYGMSVDRTEVIAAFAAGNPPVLGRALPPIIIGLWGGLLEGGKIAIERTATGQLTGELAFP